MKHFALTVALLLSAIIPASAQGVFTSHIFASPMITNPALTGFITDDIRAAIFYSGATDTSATFRRINASVDLPVLKNKLPAGSALGVGLLYQRRSDEANTSETNFNTTGLSLAYHTSLDKVHKHHLSFGIQQIYKSSGYTYYTPLAHPHDISFSDNNAGVMYTGNISGKVALSGGASFYNMKQYAKSFPDHVYYRSYRRTTFFAAMAYTPSARTTLYTNIQRNEENNKKYTRLNAYTRLSLNPGRKSGSGELALYTGAFYIHTDYLAPYLGVEYAGLRLGFNYNIKISDHTSATTDPLKLGMSLVYSGNINKRKKDAAPANWQCPVMF